MPRPRVLQGTGCSRVRSSALPGRAEHRPCPQPVWAVQPPPVLPVPFPSAAGPGLPGQGQRPQCRGAGPAPEAATGSGVAAERWRPTRRLVRDGPRRVRPGRGRLVGAAPGAAPRSAPAPLRLRPGCEARPAPEAAGGRGSRGGPRRAARSAPCPARGKGPPPGNRAEREGGGARHDRGPAAAP